MSVKERLITYLNYKKVSKSDFGRSIGVSSAYVTSMRKSIDPEKLQSIAKNYPDLNTGWLMTGEGEMLKNSEPVQMDFGSSSTDQSDQLFHTVPLVPTSAQGGPLNDFVASIKENECERIVSPVRYADLAITVAGDSMAPEFPSGCQILIKRINEKAFIEWGKVYVLDTCNGTVIKEVHRGKAEDEIECYSINPDPKFQPFSVKFADIFGMYKVIMCMSLK